jgi:GNAT superfamily N-acetyltransferase
LREATRLGGRILVAERDSRVVGLLTLHSTPSLHRTPDGRITALVVDESARDGGVGGALVREAESICRSWGCGRMEVTSSIDRADAHRFYEMLGYRETRKRFRKPLVGD